MAVCLFLGSAARRDGGKMRDTGRKGGFPAVLGGVWKGLARIGKDWQGLESLGKHKAAYLKIKNLRTPGWDKAASVIKPDGTESPANPPTGMSAPPKSGEKPHNAA